MKFFLTVIFLLVAIGIISWYRSSKKTIMNLITSQDKITANGCMEMAFQMLGSALEPYSAESPADAIAAGKKALTNQDMSCAIVVNLLSMGFLSGYIAKHKLSSDRTQALMWHLSILLTDSFKLNHEELWNRSGELSKVRGPLGFLMQNAARDGVLLPGEVQEGSVLSGLILDAIKQAAFQPPIMHL